MTLTVEDYKDICRTLNNIMLRRDITTDESEALAIAINDVLFNHCQEAAKGGSDSSRVAVGTKTDSSNPKPPRKSLNDKCKECRKEDKIMYNWCKGIKE